MSVTVGQVLTAARDRHPMFVKPRVPDVVLVRALSIYQRTLLSKLVARDATQALTTLTTNAPIDPTVAVTLPAYKRIVGGTVALTSPSGATCPLTLLGYQSRFRGELGDYQAIVTGQTLTWGGSLAHWSDVASVSLHYVPEPADLAALTDTFVLPDSALPVLVARCAVAAADRVSGLPEDAQLDPAPFMAALTEAESVWLAEVSGQTRNRTHRMRRGRY